MVESLVGIERDLFLWLNSPHSYYLDSVMYLMSDKWPWVVYFLLFIFYMSRGQKWKEVLLFVLGLLMVVFLADGISSGIFKPIFQRFRPTHHPLTEEEVKTVLDYRGGNYGFISGHTTNFIAFALFTSLVIRYRWYTIVSHIVALVVAYSRIYLGVHFITDVLPGVIVGLLCGWVSYLLYREARVAFLGIERRDVDKCYLRPIGRDRAIAVLLAVCFVLIWAVAPAVIKYY